MEEYGTIMKKAVLISLIALNLFASQRESYKEGINSAKSILSELKSNMDSRINNPITKGESLYTFDNSKSAQVSITCAEEKNILQVSYSVSSGGNINIRVDEDFNLDGSYESSESISEVSGVCANGVIKCSDGGWNNCKYYYLNFNGSNYYLTQTTDISKLSGCYCINASCDNLSSNAKDKVLSDIAGLLANLIRNRYYVVSNITLNGDYAYVSGKNINCEGEKAPLGMSVVDLEEKTQEEQTNQMNDTNSVYYLLNETATNVNNNQPNDDYKESLKNKQQIISSNSEFDENSKVYSYTDENGTRVDGDVYFENLEDIKYCEVEYYEKSPDVFSDKTTRTSSTSSDEVKKTKIIECKNNHGSWICPVGENETIKHNCGNINEFGEVTGVLNSIDDAVKDFSCSTK